MTPYTAQIPSRPRPAAPAPTPAVESKPVVEVSTTIRAAAPARTPTPVPPAVAATPTGKTHLSTHALALHNLTLLRDRQTSCSLYRTVSNQLLAVLLFEATRNLAAREVIVETMNGDKHDGQRIAKPIVLLSLAKHSLGLAHNAAELFSGLVVGTVSLNRAGESLVEPRLHLANAPALCDAHVILFDPVVATGASAQAALSFLQRSGAKQLSLMSFLVSLPGVSRLHSTFPDLQVWTAAIDSEWDAKRGPLPGIGTFAERLYG